MVQKSQPYNLVVCIFRMMYMEFGAIWLHRLEDHNALVLKKDAEIFFKLHLELKFDFETYSNEKT